jgi:histidinol-phosphate phosphatase family protein
MNCSAVFYDLQGTLGGDGLGDIMEFRFYENSIKAIKLLNEYSIPVIIVTNQSRIAKGHLTMEDFNNKLEKLKEELTESGAHFDAVYCCPHDRKDNCQCKKPLTGMLLQASREFGITLYDSYVVGDMGMSDMVMATTVGAKAILVLTGVGQGNLTTFRHTWEGIEPDYIAEDALEAARWIVENIKAV